MDAPLNILIAIVLTSFPFGCLFAWLFLDWRRMKVAILGAATAAAIWAIGYGIYGWKHRMDWEHIRNYPLWIHAVMMTFSAVAYSLVGFLPALAGAVLLRRTGKVQT